MQGEKKQTCQAKRQLAQPRNWERDHPDKKAERSADTARDIAEISGPLDRLRSTIPAVSRSAVPQAVRLLV